LAATLLTAFRIVSAGGAGVNDTQRMPTDIGIKRFLTQVRFSTDNLFSRIYETNYNAKILSDY
ncbi:MAG TPA: hypothetical protein VN451_03885, partial [Chitinophagaceae bacterium]|nr:hypothetical protein [Chitinophagaceae bacterium]